MNVQFYKQVLSSEEVFIHFLALTHGQSGLSKLLFNELANASEQTWELGGDTV